MNEFEAILVWEVFNIRSNKVTGRFSEKGGAVWFRNSREDLRPCDPIKTQRAKPAGYGGGLGFGIYGNDMTTQVNSCSCEQCKKLQKAFDN